MATFIRNKKVSFDYEILEKFDAGIELFGFEVKSIKSNHGNIEGSHITVRGGEAFLLNANIPPYQTANTPKDYNPERNRRLLLTKKELSELSGLEEKKGLTIVPISMYNKGKKIKIEIAVVRGKKKFDKRESIKKKDTERDLRREIKSRL
ncbi:TPA: SsrA-binding protein [Candidatus Campbellbacteria bacterium]|nr:MAG: SsrA-binding protein, SsrA-binding protein [Candidatus Campbellbacteria bacterium GW2011_OD1_34_28]KKP75387.1 MAG: SsrA-binding protein [Candidatus Campbellbacteria bacterium GW2011_GWD2_35_24]KKP76052.1 MAG: SsrA-binding protein, SsrA-binding protein [Candidatus Campbellbacteria bacterium GW2011_GWC2_35_28]KKP77241.1 MAG: SsrA-binding protein [Candidatus Campbellbacteria bacterium GW2011_GWC1_35_31]KKP79170.1 MAG: SsrA-binding protein [Candidatus Campbellbacteria bacterium GW2011_GWD1_